MNTPVRMRQKHHACKQTKISKTTTKRETNQKKSGKNLVYSRNRGRASRVRIAIDEDIL